jgi:predicted O-methyltransferase YrrM
MIDAILNADALMMPWEKLTLFTLVRTLNRRKCLEIGSYKGGSAFIINKALETTDGKLICIDPDHQAPDALREEIKERVSFWDGYSPNLIEKAVQTLGGLDFVHIDGDHSYEAVLADCEALEKHLNEGAFLLLHDITIDGTKKAIDEWLKKNVHKAHDCGFMDIILGDCRALYCGYRFIRWGHLMDSESKQRSKIPMI